MNKILILLAMTLIMYGLSGTVLAQTQTSPNFELREGSIDSGGSFQGSSPNFSSQGTTGDTGVGNSASDNYRSTAGFNTTDDPRLVLIINTSSVNFGALSTTATSTATSTFSVLNYTAYGYSVYTIGSPPSNNSHTLSGMSSAGPSQVGVEQYGINLKANTSPVSQGADPVQVPSGIFAFGTASTGYNTANNYRYVAGEKISESAQSSGETDYTISYIVNASTTTPGGQYSGSQGLVVVGNY